MIRSDAFKRLEQSRINKDLVTALETESLPKVRFFVKKKVYKSQIFLTKFSIAYKKFCFAQAYKQ